MIYKIISIAFGLIFCLSLASCLTRVDEALPYAELPQITLATEVKLVASPAHPAAYLSSSAVAAGTSVTLLGATQDMSWLLVLHEQMVGWMPTFFSRDNISTLTPALTFTTPSKQCTSYLGATFAPDEVWTSIAEGTVMVIGVIYRPAVQPNFAQSTLTVAIAGVGQAVDADYVHVDLTPTTSLVLFTYVLNNLQKGSQISFALADSGNEPLIFEAAYFSDSCAETQRFTAQLPVGAPKGLAVQPAATPTGQPTATLQPASTGIVHTSDARTPTPIPIPTPFPTLDSEIYGTLIKIGEISASSVYPGNSYPISNAIDENLSSFWSSNTDDDIGAWLQLKLVKPTTVTGIHIYSPYARGGHPKDILLIFSDNSNQRIHLDNTEGWQYNSLTPVKTDNVKLVVESVHATGLLNTTKLYEIQILGEPQAPVLIETGNPAVSIRLRSGQFAEDAQSIGRVRANFWMHDGQPIGQGTVNIFPLDKDIAGELLRMDAIIRDHSPDEDGSYLFELPPQQYLLTFATAITDDEPIVPSWYSDSGYVDADKEQYRGIIFPVEAGKTTEITVQFSRLVVGVLDESGRAVRGDNHPGWMVVVCADAMADVTDETLRCAKQAIDRRGAAAFQLAPGDYYICVLTEAACYWEFPVSVSLQEAKEEIVSINSSQPDTCLDGK